MAYTIEFPEKLIKFFNTDAKEEFDKCVKVFALALSNEAGRLESNINSTKNKPQIISTNVKDADTALRHGTAKIRRSGLKKISSIVSGISGPVIGLLYDPSSLINNKILFAVFIFLIAIFLYTLIISNSD